MASLLQPGCVSDGEFNSLRAQGTDRPVSLIQLIMDAKKSAKAMKARDIELFLMPINVGKIFKYISQM